MNTKNNEVIFFSGIDNIYLKVVYSNNIILKSIEFIVESKVKNKIPLEIEDVCKKLISLINGENISFKFNIDIGHLTDFQIKVFEFIQKIPKGKVMSYKNIAEGIGNINSSRAVGTVMRKNKFPLIFPCHRVVSSNMKIGGFNGEKKGDFVNFKKKILLNEGVIFNKDKINKKSYL